MLAKRISGALVVLLLSLLAASCLNHSPSVGDTALMAQAMNKVQAAEQTQFTDKDEYYIGRSATALILKTHKVYEDQKATDYINLLGTALTIYSKRPETYGGYHFLILDSDEVNGFAAPGGFILVCRGLVRCAQNEDELASILSQLISHVVLRHGLQAIKMARLTAAYRDMAVTAAATMGSPEAQELTEVFKDSIASVDAQVNAGFARKAVLEADKMAVGIMSNAGYDPNRIIPVLKSLKSKLKPGQQPHPSPDERIAALQSTLAAMPEAKVSSEAETERRLRYTSALSDLLDRKE